MLEDMTSFVRPPDDYYGVAELAYQDLAMLRLRLPYWLRLPVQLDELHYLPSSIFLHSTSWDIVRYTE